MSCNRYSEFNIGHSLESACKNSENIDKGGMLYHTAIIGQSGSGKSFTLGRLLEEIASKSNARIIILDPNSDFIKFSKIDYKKWDDPDLHFDSEDTKKNFQKYWKMFGISLFTNRDVKELRLPKKAIVLPISLDWNQIDFEKKVAYLGHSLMEDWEEVSVIEKVLHLEEKNNEKGKDKMRLRDYGLRESYPGSLNSFCGWSDILVELSHNFSDNKKYKSLLREYKIEDSFHIHGISYQAAHRVNNTAVWLLNNYEIWAPHDNPVDSMLSPIKQIIDETTKQQVGVLDLPCIESPEAQLLVIDATLESIWKTVKKKWEKAIKKPPERDTRVPVFIVIDEAHNLAPVKTQSVMSQKIQEQIIRIAAEGRKYGLFLIIATQRPSKVHTSVLSQCDNLILQKMNSQIDKDLIKDIFGFVQSNGEKDRVNDFEKGDAFIYGQLVKKPAYVHIAPRRTAESGRNIKKEYLKKMRTSKKINNQNSGP